MRTLETRLIVLTALWTLIALAIVATILGAFADNHARRAIDMRLAAAADQLASNLEIGADGTVALSRQPDESGFQRPRSGWLWLVERDGKAIAQSRSLADREADGLLAAMRNAAQGGFGGERLALVERPVAAAHGGPGRLLATAPLAGVEAEIAAARGTIAAIMIGFGLIFIAGVALQLRLGLRPMRALAADIDAVRAGRSARVRTPAVADLGAVANAINRLIEALASTAARSREEASNLAHALKTPLSVIMLRAAPGGPAADAETLARADHMKRQIDRRLRRPRAVAGLARPRTLLRPVIEDAVLAASRAHGARGVSHELALEDGLAIATARDELEEILGNLIDNAFKWASAAVRVTARRDGEWAVVAIDDDGPGVAADRIDDILRRGVRLDEAAPGDGLGLAIAVDILGDIGGRLDLSRSEMKGLRATAALPAAPSC